MESSLPHKKQSGFTLIELLISLILGLLMLGAVGAVYIGSKRTYSERDTLSLVQENGRIAIQMLEYGISPAGYPAIDDFDPFVHDNDATVDGATAADSDKIGIRFSPGLIAGTLGYVRDCLGNENADVEFIESLFTVKDGNLRCSARAVPSGDRDKPVEDQVKPGSPQPIAEGVESMQIRYGVLTGAGDEEILELFTADQVNDWKQVISVKIELAIESPKETDPFAGKARTFSTTIPLRNRIPLPDQEK